MDPDVRHLKEDVMLLPSDDATFQIVELDELPKTAGVVILSCLGVAEGLFNTQEIQGSIKMQISL